MMRLYSIMVDGALIQKYGVYTFDNLIAAEKQYYRFLSADIDDASKVTVLDLLMDSYGNVIKKELYDHRAEEEYQTAAYSDEQDTEPVM